VALRPRLTTGLLFSERDSASLSPFARSVPYPPWQYFPITDAVEFEHLGPETASHPHESFPGWITHRRPTGTPRVTYLTHDSSSAPQVDFRQPARGNTVRMASASVQHFTEPAVVRIRVHAHHVPPAVEAPLHQHVRDRGPCSRWPANGPEFHSSDIRAGPIAAGEQIPLELNAILPSWAESYPRYSSTRKSAPCRASGNGNSTRRGAPPLGSPVILAPCYTNFVGQGCGQWFGRGHPSRCA